MFSSSESLEATVLLEVLRLHRSVPFLQPSRSKFLAHLVVSTRLLPTLPAPPASKYQSQCHVFFSLVPATPTSRYQFLCQFPTVVINGLKRQCTMSHDSVGQLGFAGQFCSTGGPSRGNIQLKYLEWWGASLASLFSSSFSSPRSLA